MNMLFIDGAGDLLLLAALTKLFRRRLGGMRGRRRFAGGIEGGEFRAAVRIEATPLRPKRLFGLLLDAAKLLVLVQENASFLAPRRPPRAGHMTSTQGL